MAGLDITIEAQVREGRGKSYARKIRREGKIPGNVLNKGTATAIELNPKLLSKAYKGGKQFQLNLGGETKAVKIHGIDFHPVKRKPLHVDLIYV